MPSGQLLDAVVPAVGDPEIAGGVEGHLGGHVELPDPVACAAELGTAWTESCEPLLEDDITSVAWEQVSAFPRLVAIIKPTRFALETSQLQSEYFQCWQDLAKNFTPETK